MRRLRLAVGTVLCLSGLLGGGFYQDAGAVTYSNNRIAIDADGNYNDTDDWGSTPMELALLARRGLQPKLVYYSWANIIGPNDSTFYNQMRTSTLGAADRFGFARAKFFDCRTNLLAAINNLRNQIDLSTSSDPIFIIALGPMEVLWRAVNVSDPAKRQYVTVISHTNWNANTTYPPRCRIRARTSKRWACNGFRSRTRIRASIPEIPTVPPTGLLGSGCELRRRCECVGSMAA